MLFGLAAVIAAKPWGPRASPAKRVAWGEEEGMERAESSPQAGMQQSGISSDDARPVSVFAVKLANSLFGL